MDNSTHDMSEKLLQYLDGELSGPEKTEMERELAENKQLQEELENLELARKAVNAYGLKQKVAGIHAQMIDEMQLPVKQIKNTRRIVVYFLAAAVAAAVLLLFLFPALFNQRPPSAEKLFADNYHAYDLSITRGGSAESAIEKAYREKNYKLVITLADTSATIKNNFLTAMSFIELKKDSAAIDKLIGIQLANQQENTNTLLEETEYYLSLLYLRNKMYTASLELMNKIHDNPSHLYHERIKDNLLNEVQKKAQTKKDFDKLP